MFPNSQKLLSTGRQWSRMIIHCRNVQTKPQDPEFIHQMDSFDFAEDKISLSRQSKSIYCWGFSATGAFGRESYLSKYEKGGHIAIPKQTFKSKPQRIRFLNPKSTRFYDASAGFGFTVIAATYIGTSHILFGCGLNTDSQLGYQATIGSKEPLVCIANFVPIDLPLEQSSTKIKESVIKVSCGRAHTVCLTNNSNVFTLGNNSFGQCGRPIVENEKYFASKRIHHLKFDDNDPIKDIVCGLDHTLFLSQSGSVYSCGWGCDGQLGNGKFESCSTPTKVIGDIDGEKIVQLSSSGDCVLALNDKGQVFGWGNSEYGQIGLNMDHSAQIPVAKHLKFDFGRVISVAAAGSMCSLVNDEGVVFVWGYGTLGLGPKLREKTIPTPMKGNLFGTTTFNKHTKVVQVAAGLHQFGAINDKGEAFIWGRNNRPGKQNNEMIFPIRLDIPLHVLKLSLGIDHSLAIGRKLI